MLTIEYLVGKKYPLSHVLTDSDKKELLLENKEGDYSYLSLMREMFNYTVTVECVLRGWSGIKIVKV
jgi:hypothetical protein